MDQNDKKTVKTKTKTWASEMAVVFITEAHVKLPFIGGILFKLNSKTLSSGIELSMEASEIILEKIRILKAHHFLLIEIRRMEVSNLRQNTYIRHKAETYVTFTAFSAN